MSAATRPGLALLRSRRTVVLFKSEKPPRERLLEAVEAARWAPNHRLTEPWRFYLLGPGTARALTGIAEALTLAEKGAEAAKGRRRLMEAVPAWIAVSCRKSEDPFREREDYGACCCAIQNMMLCLWESGLGCKWSTGALTRDARFHELLGVDARKRMVAGLFAIGYPQRVPRQKRRPVEDILATLD